MSSFKLLYSVGADEVARAIHCALDSPAGTTTGAATTHVAELPVDVASDNAPTVLAFCSVSSPTVDARSG